MTPEREPKQVNQHAQEPWKTVPDNGIDSAPGVCRIVWGTDGRDAAYCPIGSGRDRSNANAARIVACVNACRGLSNDILEKIAASGGCLWTSEASLDRAYRSIEDSGLPARAIGSSPDS